MVKNKQTLHDEMKSILQEVGGEMSAEKIAPLLKYQAIDRKTGEKRQPSSFQIAARANGHADQFEIIIRLREKK